MFTLSMMGIALMAGIGIGIFIMGVAIAHGLRNIF